MIISDFYHTLVRDLITTMVERALLHQQVTLEITQSIINEYMVEILRQCAEDVHRNITHQHDTYDSVVDSVIRGIKLGNYQIFDIFKNFFFQTL